MPQSLIESLLCLNTFCSASAGRPVLRVWGRSRRHGNSVDRPLACRKPLQCGTGCCIIALPPCRRAQALENMGATLPQVLPAFCANLALASVNPAQPTQHRCWAFTRVPQCSRWTGGTGSNPTVLPCVLSAQDTHHQAIPGYPRRSLDLVCRHGAPFNDQQAQHPPHDPWLGRRHEGVSCHPLGNCTHPRDSHAHGHSGRC